MSKPPQLAPFPNTEEQWLYSESLPDGWASYPISEGDPSHPAEKTHFGRLKPQSHSFGHDPSIKTIGEGRNEDWPVDWKLCLPAQLPFYHNCAMKCMQHHTCCSNSRPIIPSLVNKTQRYFIWGKDSFPNQSRQTTGFLQRTMASDLEVLILIPAASHSGSDEGMDEGLSNRFGDRGPDSGDVFEMVKSWFCNGFYVWLER